MFECVAAFLGPVPASPTLLTILGCALLFVAAAIIAFKILKGIAP